MDAAGYEVSAGIEPSIHVMRLTFDPGASAKDVFAHFSKSTRQRIRAAERDGTVVSEDPHGSLGSTSSRC